METNNQEMPTKYDPNAIRKKTAIRTGLKEKFFSKHKMTKRKDPYTVVIPPPNVTGKTAPWACVGFYTSRTS